MFLHWFLIGLQFQDRLINARDMSRSSSKSLVQSLNRFLYNRLLTCRIPCRFNNLSVGTNTSGVFSFMFNLFSFSDQGAVTLVAQDDFSVRLSLGSRSHGNGSQNPWIVQHVSILVPPNTDSCITSSNISKIIKLTNAKLDTCSSETYFEKLYLHLHMLSTMCRMDVFHVEALCIAEEFQGITISYNKHKDLKVLYWTSCGQLTFRSTGSSSSQQNGSPSGAVLQISVDDDYSVSVKHFPGLRAICETPGAETSCSRILGTRGFSAFFEELQKYHARFRIRQLFDLLQSGGCPKYWKLSLSDKLADEMNICFFSDKACVISVDHRAGTFKVKILNHFEESSCNAIVSQVESQLNSNPLKAIDHLRLLQRHLVYEHLLSLSYHCDFDVSKKFPIDTRMFARNPYPFLMSFLAQNKLWVFARVSDFANFYLAILVDESDALQFHVLKCESASGGSLYSSKTHTNRPINVVRLLRSHLGQNHVHANDVRQRLHDFTRSSKYIVPFQDLLEHLECSFLRSLMSTCSELAIVCISFRRVSEHLFAADQFEVLL
jgi:hypothetical protein